MYRRPNFKQALLCRVRNAVVCVKLTLQYWVLLPSDLLLKDLNSLKKDQQLLWYKWILLQHVMMRLELDSLPAKHLKQKRKMLVQTHHHMRWQWQKQKFPNTQHQIRNPEVSEMDAPDELQEKRLCKWTKQKEWKKQTVVHRWTLPFQLFGKRRNSALKKKSKPRIFLEA